MRGMTQSHREPVLACYCWPGQVQQASRGSRPGGVGGWIMLQMVQGRQGCADESNCLLRFRAQMSTM